MQESDCLDIDNFFSYLDAHLEKTAQFLKNIWYRGAILIVRKFKLLKRRRNGYTSTRWTFRGKIDDRGPEPNFSRPGDNDESSTPLQQYYNRRDTMRNQIPGFELNAVCTDLKENETLDDLLDIRECVAYQRFVRKFGRDLNLKENGYISLPKEYRRELKYAAGNLIRRQAREVVDRSIEICVNFFSGFKSFRQLQQLQQIRVSPVKQPMILAHKPTVSEKEDLKNPKFAASSHNLLSAPQKNAKLS